MKGGAVARRYARAVFEIARERGELDRWREDLGQIALALREPLMEQVAGNPKVHVARKQALVRQVLPNVSPLALNLVYLLIAKDRLDLFGEIAEEYEEFYNQQHGVEVGTVTTAVPLSPTEEQAMARRLSALTGKQIILRTKVDPGLIGGLVTQIGDRVLDGSVRARLIALRQRLKSAGTI